MWPRKYSLWGTGKTKLSNKHTTWDDLRQSLQCDHNTATVLKGITGAYSLVRDFTSPFAKWLTKFY